MKIAIDARIINSSTGRYVERLLTHLQKIDKTNEYIVLVRKKDLDFWKPRNANFRLVVAEYKNYSLNEQLGFARLLYSLDVDLVHFCMPQQPLLYFGSHVTTVHDLTLLKTYNSDKNWFTYHFKQLLGVFVFWCIARSSRHIMTPSQYTRREFVKFAKIKPSKVSVTYEAVGIHSSAPKAMDLPFKKFIMYVGQQSDYKNIRRLMQAHQSLLATYPQLGLVLVGKKSTMHRRNEEWGRRHDFKNILYTGFISDQEMAWLYKNCQAYIFPSLMEGFGLPALEAMTYGAPVVSSNATCLPEIYGDAALYFDPLDTQQMAQKIKCVLNDKAVKEQLVTQGYKRLELYSWDKTATQTHEIYMKALQGRK